LLEEMTVPLPEAGRPSLENNKEKKEQAGIVKLIFYGLCILAIGLYTYAMMRKMFFFQTLDTEKISEHHMTPVLRWNFIPEAKVFELSGIPAIYSDWSIHIQARLKQQKQMKSGEIVFQGNLIWKKDQSRAYLDQLKMIKGPGPVAGFYTIEWQLGDWQPSHWKDRWSLLLSRRLSEACIKILGVRSSCTFFDIRQTQIDLLGKQKLVFGESYFPVGGVTLESWKKDQEDLPPSIHQESPIVDDEVTQKRDLLQSFAVELERLFNQAHQKGHDSFYRSYQAQIGKPLQSLYLSEKNDQKNDQDQPHKIYLDFTEIGKEILTYLQSPPPTKHRRLAVEKAIHQRLAHLQTDIQDWKPLKSTQISKKTEDAASILK
jgi:hypothetical protein